MKWKICFLLLIILSLNVSASSSLNYLTKGFADTLYCKIGNCSGGNITYNIANQTIVQGNNVSIQYGKNQSFLPFSLDSNGFQNINIKSISSVTLNVSTQQIINAVNTTGFLINWSTVISPVASGGNSTEEMIIAVNTTGFLINWSNYFVDTDTNTWNNSIEMITAVNYSGLLINWNSTGLIKNWSYLGSTGGGNTSLEMRRAINETSINGTGFFNILWSNLIEIPSYIKDWLPIIQEVNDTINTRIDNLVLGNTTDQMITAVNTTGLLINWNSSGYIKNWNSSGLIINWSNIISSSIGNTTIQMYNAVNNTVLNLKYNSSIGQIKFNQINLGGDSYPFLNSSEMLVLQTPISFLEDGTNRASTYYINSDLTSVGIISYLPLESKFSIYDLNEGSVNLEVEGDINSTAHICDGFGKCLDSVDTYNTTQQMYNAVNNTNITHDNLIVNHIHQIGTWCQYENSTGSFVLERNCVI